MIPLVGMDERVLVALADENWKLGEIVGRARYDSAIAAGRHVFDNGRAASVEEIIDEYVHGARGEIAVHGLFPWLPWHDLSDRVDDLPDIGDFIDVKAPAQDPSSNKPRKLIAYDSQLRNDWAFVLALYVGRQRFRIMGWASSAELRAAPIKELQPGRPCHVLEPSIPPLHPLRQLQEIALTRHHRQALEKEKEHERSTSGERSAQSGDGA